MTDVVLLIDLDGVIYKGDHPIDGAARAIDRLQEWGVPHLFLTNTTSRPRSALVEKLSGMGIRADENRIFTPPVAARQWIGDQVDGPVALFVPATTRGEFEGLDLLGDDRDTAAAVVVGDLGEDWDFATLNRAFRLLMNEPQPQLLALGMTRYWRAPDGLRLDAGAFVSALAYASGLQPVVLGKPAADFFRAACALLGAEPAGACMIGDDIRSDVGGAQDAGLRGIQVRTGKFRPADLDGEVRPDAVLDSIADLPDWLGAGPGG